MLGAAKTYRVNEIFYSLQGEGYHVGTPAIFVRLAGCNLHCDFCDTEFEEYERMTAEEIARAASDYCPAVSNDIDPCPNPATPSQQLSLLVLTGGEPALQVDDELLTALHQAGFYVAIETNGTHPLPSAIDWITCSPKERVRIEKADEVKVVYLGQNVEKWYSQIQAEHYFLQPCSMENTLETIAYIKSHPHWRLSLQTQKYLDIK